MSRIDRSVLESFFPSHWEIFSVGKPGGKITDMREMAPYYINVYTPDYVFVQIGGNDIKRNTNPSLILFDLMETIYYIKNLGPFSVFVGGIFPRSNPRFIESNDYCKIKSFLNKQLYFSCEHSHNIFFCSTRKFKMSDLCHDGVHFSKKGQSKWLREVSSCIKRQLPVVKF